MIRATITGIYEIDLKLARIADKANRKLIQRAIRPTGTQVLAAAKARVPRKTGALGATLKLNNFTRAIKGGTGRKVGVAIKVAKRYGRFQEFGTKYHPAQKFLRPALYDKREQYVAEARAALLDVINNP